MSATPPSTPSSSSPSSYRYRCTASHHRTLNVLGKVKNFTKLSIEELSGYCGLVKDEDGVQTAEDAAEALTARFGWPTTTRLLDIEAAWMSINKNANNLDANDISEAVAKEIPSKILSKTVGENTAGKMSEATKSASSIPIVMKNNSWDRKVLICEILDDEFSILGDSGAVGRISVDPSSLLIDVKGRQYRGKLYSGPTVMLLNLAAPVGLSTSSGTYQQTARAEVVTNEFCQLSFEKDLLGSMMGLYTGSGGAMASFNDNDDEDGDSNRKKSAKRSNDDEDHDSGDADETTAKAKAPKISTITNRTRTVKKGTKKKSVKSVKQKK